MKAASLSVKHLFSPGHPKSKKYWSVEKKREIHGLLTLHVLPGRLLSTTVLNICRVPSAKWDLMALL